MSNIGWLYYKEYYRDADFCSLLKNPQGPITIAESKNEVILKSPLKKIPSIGKQTLLAKVCYPGLITGVGIGHEAKLEGEFKLGMHFDYTYGMPVVYGSSVKGLLRSMFRYHDYIQEKLAMLNAENVEISELEKNMFDGIVEGKHLGIYERDIFYDAVIVETNRNGRILEKDFLAPHGSNPLKNPQPLMFLKIASGVTVEFRFDLKDFGKAETNRSLSAAQKCELFKAIISDVGIGAKTNVGYGQIEIIEMK